MAPDTLASNQQLATPAVGDIDPSGATAPGELHFEVHPPGAPLSPGTTTATPQPTALPDMIAQEAQRRLGLGFTPDLSDPDMKAAITKALSAQPVPTGQPMPGLPPPMGPAMVVAQAKVHEANVQDLDAIVKNYDPSASYDPTQTMPPGPAFLIGRQLGMTNWGDADQQFHQLYPQGDLISVGGYPLNAKVDTWLYREDPTQPFKPLGTLAGIGELANVRNAANIGAIALPGELGLLRVAGLTGLLTSTGDYTDYLMNRAQGFSKDIDEASALQRAGESGAQASFPLYAMYGAGRVLPWAARYATQLGRGVLNLASLNISKAAGSIVPPGTAEYMGSKGVNILSRLATPEMLDLSNQAVGAGLTPLTVGQVGPKTIQLIARQTGATSGKMQETILAQMNSARQAIEGAIAKNPDAAANPFMLQKMVDAERDQLLGELPVAKMGQSVSGMNLQSGVQAWRQNSRELVRQLGDKAAEAAGDTWIGMPMKPLQDAAKEIRTGVLAPGRPPEEADEAIGIPAPVQPVQVEPPSRDIKPYLQVIDRIGDRLGNVEDADGNVHNAFDQFIAIRDGLYNLKNESPDALTRQQAYTLWNATQEMARAAESEITEGGTKGGMLRPAVKLPGGKIITGKVGQVHGELTNNPNAEGGWITPTGKFLDRDEAAIWHHAQFGERHAGDQITGESYNEWLEEGGAYPSANKYTQDFRATYQKFIDTYKETETASDVLRSLLNARDPGAVAKAVTQPGRLKTLLTIKKALDGTPQQEAWDAIVDGFRSSLQEDLVKGGQRIAMLQKRDPEMVNALISPREQETWKELADTEQAIRRSLTGRLAETSETNMDNAIKLAQTGTKDELARYVARTGGTTGEFATAIRGGVWQDILNGAKKVDERTGEESIDPYQLNRSIRNYMIGPRRDALDSVMTPADWDTMSLLRRYSAVVGADVSSIGGSLQAGQIASHLTDIHGMVANKARWALSVLKMVNNKLVSDMLASPVGEKLFVNAINQKTIPSSLRVLNGAVSYISQSTLHPQRQQPTHIQGEQ